MRVIIAAFLVAILVQLQSEVLIGWFGPWLTLVPVLALFGRWMGSPGAYAMGVYGTSIVGGIVGMEMFGMSNGDSARLAGWVLPPALTVAYGVLVLVRAGLRRVLPERVVAELDAGAHRFAWAMGGMVVGFFVGTFAGVTAYYFTDVGTVVDFVVPDGGDQLLVSAAAVFGGFAGIFLSPQAATEFEEPEPPRS